MFVISNDPGFSGFIFFTHNIETLGKKMDYMNMNAGNIIYHI